MPNEFNLTDCARLSSQHWVLEIGPDTPETFHLYKRLHRQPRLAFSGELALINNDESIDISSFRWQFRLKAERIEQWCNVQLEESLSLGITYRFHNGALVIDYLARHRVPTCLDFRHQICQRQSWLDSRFSSSEVIEPINRLQHRYHGQPSDYLCKSDRRRFKEAFSATQWVLLEEPVLPVR
jgi:hypothetical protein